MASAYQDLYIDQGTTFTEQITLTDQNGAAYNLANETTQALGYEVVREVGLSAQQV